jgi:hypothetical protein
VQDSATAGDWRLNYRQHDRRGSRLLLQYEYTLRNGVASSKRMEFATLELGRDSSSDLQLPHSSVLDNRPFILTQSLCTALPSLFRSPASLQPLLVARRPIRWSVRHSSCGGEKSLLPNWPSMLSCMYLRIIRHRGWNHHECGFALQS